MAMVGKLLMLFIIFEIAMMGLHHCYIVDKYPPASEILVRTICSLTTYKQLDMNMFVVNTLAACRQPILLLITVVEGIYAIMFGVYLVGAITTEFIYAKLPI